MPESDTLTKGQCLMSEKKVSQDCLVIHIENAQLNSNNTGSSYICQSITERQKRKLTSMFALSPYVSHSKHS